jgi:methylated-DNA-[protein]-cysteine S-methyltransferase
MTDSFLLFETALGVCGLAWTETGLTRMQLPEITPAATERRLRAPGCLAWEASTPSEIAIAIDLLRRYFVREKVNFLDLSLDMSRIRGFEAGVYDALRLVPYGRTTTYGALADAVSSPGAAQAIGIAMGRNPWPVIVPCHRVLAASKKIGGFSAPGGVSTKRKLLGMESSVAPPEEDLFGG